MNVEVKLKKIELRGVASAIADRIKRSIHAAPGNRWNKTGHLLQSISVVGNSDGSAGVTVAADRLRQPEMAGVFTREILTDPTRDSAVRSAISKAVADAIELKVTK